MKNFFKKFLQWCTLSAFFLIYPSNSQYQIGNSYQNQVCSMYLEQSDKPTMCKIVLPLLKLSFLTPGFCVDAFCNTILLSGLIKNWCFALLLLEGIESSHKHQFTFYLGKTRLSTFAVDCHLLFSSLGGLGWIPFFIRHFMIFAFSFNWLSIKVGRVLSKKVTICHFCL